MRLALVFCALLATGTATAAPVGKLPLPGDILRRVAAGADRLEVVPYDERGKPLLVVTDRAAIAELLKAIDAAPNEPGSIVSHMCGGEPPIRLYRKGVIVASFSFDHASLLRPVKGKLWTGGDVQVTEASARAMAAWFQRHGYPRHQQEIDEQDRERSRWEAFHSAFPPAVRAFLREDERAQRAVLPGAGEPSSIPDALAEAVPDEIERARIIMRALGGYDGEWFSYGSEEKVVLDWASRLSPEKLVAAVDGVPDDSPELLGAARLLFGSPASGKRWKERLDVATARRLAARVAPAVFADAATRNSQSLPLALASLRSPEIERILAGEAGKVGQAADGACSRMEQAAPAVSALVVLAAWRKADPAQIAAATARTWKCGANRGGVGVAAALAAGVLPGADDLKVTDLTAALIALARIEKRPTREAVDLAFDALMNHPWGHIRSETEEWLSRIAKLQSSDRDRPGALGAWWRTARETWQAPGPAK